MARCRAFGQIDEDSGQTPNSNDPYIYVDKFTDRLVKFDMQALAAMFVEFSDNDGETWSIPYPVEGYYCLLYTSPSPRDS